ncbi:MAG TPA: ABC transporter permease [Thermomicrobiaceae bacterium]|nr:ABC transporter permease [Thermomicrobiaceae bacterium]
MRETGIAGTPREAGALDVLGSARRGRQRSPLARFVRNRAAGVGAAIILLIVLTALLAPVIAPDDPYHQDLAASLQGPSAGHLFGTDSLGRDVLSRVLYGGRITIPMGVAAVAIALILGVPVGLFSGYRLGWTDTLAMRLTDILLAFPSLLLAMAIMAALGVHLWTVSVAIAVTSIPLYVRLVRGEVMRLRGREFVDAARCVGVNDRTIVFRHILPNALSPIIIQASLNAALAILSVSALSFIGLGAQPPSAEWGAMLADGRSVMQVAWNVTTFPGIAIVLVVLGFNLLGDGLRDAYDPRSRR